MEQPTAGRIRLECFAVLGVADQEAPARLRRRNY